MLELWEKENWTTRGNMYRVECVSVKMCASVWDAERRNQFVSHILWVSVWKMHCMQKMLCHRGITVQRWAKEMHFHSYSERVCGDEIALGDCCHGDKLLRCLRHRIRWLRSFSCGRIDTKQMISHIKIYIIVQCHISQLKKKKKKCDISSLKSQSLCKHSDLTQGIKM